MYLTQIKSIRVMLFHFCVLAFFVGFRHYEVLIIYLWLWEFYIFMIFSQPASNAWTMVRFKSGSGLKLGHLMHERESIARQLRASTWQNVTCCSYCCSVPMVLPNGQTISNFFSTLFNLEINNNNNIIMKIFCLTPVSHRCFFFLPLILGDGITHQYVKY